MNRIIPVRYLITLGVVVCCCRNPFLPETGIPVEHRSTDLRATPQGVVEQLIESYESRRIDLFEELLPADGSFRFFIAPDFFDTYKNKYKNLKETRDTRLQHIGQSDYYYYWTQAEELEGHERLFNQAERIEFTDKPALEDIHSFVDNGDAFAEVLLTGGNLKIGKWIDTDTVELYTVPITQQVFLLEKDEDDLWVITKWYDFSIGSE
jgi:hypothetical protein